MPVRAVPHRYTGRARRGQRVASGFVYRIMMIVNYTTADVNFNASVDPCDCSSIITNNVSEYHCSGQPLHTLPRVVIYIRDTDRYHYAVVHAIGSIRYLHYMLSTCYTSQFFLFMCVVISPQLSSSSLLGSES